MFFRQAFSGYDRPAHELLRTDAAALSSSDRGNASNRVLTGRTAALGRLVRVQEALLGEDHPSVVRTLLARARAPRVSTTSPRRRTALSARRTS